MSFAWADAAALAIGERILAEAVVEGGAATWWVLESVKGSNPPRAEAALAGGSFYGGTAGVALFLSELSAVTGRTDFRGMARMAIEHALTRGPGADEPLPSLHGGTVGILFAAASYLRHGEDKELRSRSEGLLQALQDNPTADRGLDLIGGAAGGIPGLLAIGDVFDARLIEGICTPLGEQLIELAQVEPIGLSWPSGAPRGGNLCGLAHGAAGYGLALLELFGRTGRALFRLGAEEAFAYEESQFDPEQGNWPDLRNAALHRYFTEDRLDELRSLPGEGKPLPLYEKTFMTAWCHGAPGIALTRARAFALLGNEQYRRQALAAVPAIRRSLLAPELGHSLCHGFMGNAEALLVIAEACHAPELRAWVLRHTRAVTAEVTSSGERWRSGRLGQAEDVSLMLGEAGIGLFLLSLRHGVVSASFPVVSITKAPRVVRDGDVLRRKIAEGCFPRSTAILGPSRLLHLLSQEEDDVPTSERVEAAFSALATRDAALAEAVRVDSMVLTLRRQAPVDPSLTVLSRVFRPEGGEDETLVLAPWVQVLEQETGTLLLYPDSRCRWSARPLSEQVAALLSLLRTPRSGMDVAEALAAEGGVAPQEVSAWVRSQIDALWAAGIAVVPELAEGIEPFPAHGHLVPGAPTPSRPGAARV